MREKAKDCSSRESDRRGDEGLGGAGSTAEFYESVLFGGMGALTDSIGLPPVGHPAYREDSEQRPMHFEHCEMAGSTITSCNVRLTSLVRWTDTLWLVYTRLAIRMNLKTVIGPVSVWKALRIFRTAWLPYRFPLNEMLLHGLRNDVGATYESLHKLLDRDGYRGKANAWNLEMQRNWGSPEETEIEMDLYCSIE